MGAKRSFFHLTDEHVHVLNPTMHVQAFPRVPSSFAPSFSALAPFKDVQSFCDAPAS